MLTMYNEAFDNTCITIWHNHIYINKHAYLSLSLYIYIYIYILCEHPQYYSDVNYNTRQFILLTTSMLYYHDYWIQYDVNVKYCKLDGNINTLLAQGSARAPSAVARLGDKAPSHGRVLRDWGGDPAAGDERVKKKRRGSASDSELDPAHCGVLVSVWLCAGVCKPHGLSIATTMGQARPTYVARHRGPGVKRYGQFPKNHVCFWGLDSGYLKFDSTDK